MVDYTNNLRLPLPPLNKAPWIEDYHNAMRIIDGVFARYLAIANFQGIWQNATAYTVGDRVLDYETSVIFEAASTHTSPTYPTTFSEDRSANPTRWASYSSDVTFRGEWNVDTDYALGDFVTSASSFAIALTSHRSGASFSQDASQGKWSVLINGDEILTDANAAKVAAEAAADAAEAAAATLPSPTGNDDQFVKVDGTGTSFETVTEAQVLAQLGFSTQSLKTVSATQPLESIAHRTAAQNVLAAATDKILYNGEESDPNGWFDTVTNNRFTPTNGSTLSWLVSARAVISGLTDQADYLIEIHRNGTLYKRRRQRASGTGNLSLEINDRVRLDGVTDFIEIFVGNGGAGTLTIAGGSTETTFTAMAMTY